MDSVHKAEELIKDKTIGTLLENVNVYDLLRAHEFFHGIDITREDIFTHRQKRSSFGDVHFLTNQKLLH